MKIERRLKRLEQTQKQQARDRPGILTLIHRDGTHEKVRDSLNWRVEVTSTIFDYVCAEYNNRPYPDTEIIGVIYPDGEQIMFKELAERKPTQEETDRVIQELKQIGGERQ